MADTTGRVALVTGAGRRVGRAIALGLAHDGFRVAIHYNASATGAEALARDIAAAGFPPATLFSADLRSATDAEALPRQVAERMGRLDVLVNSAAVMLKQPFGSVTPAMWDDVLNLNLRAAFFTAQGGAPALRASHGCIVNISDLAAFDVWPSYLPHNVSKAGIEMLTRGLARVLAPDVRVNAVAPGPVLLPDDWSADAAKRTASDVPLQRLGSPDDVVQAVRYLLAAGYVTGTTLVVDGGQRVR
jgi:pteridine reductase